MKSGREMFFEITVPNKGYSISEFTVIEICKQKGDSVHLNEEVCLIESEKSVHSVISAMSGIIENVYVREGDIVAVGEQIFMVRCSEIVSPHMPVKLSSLSETKLNQRDHSENATTVIRPARFSDYDSMYDLWCQHQSLASRSSSTANLESLKAPFIAMLCRAKIPFCTLVAESGGNVTGWGAIFPCKNNPLTSHRVAEVTIYVTDPESTSSPASFLLKKLIQHSQTNKMAFLIGFTNPDNLKVSKLLQGLNFRLLGSAGVPPTEIWVFSC